MLRAPHHKDYSGTIKKIEYLIDALHAEEQRYNTDAETINHTQLRDSIRNLAQKNDHYAGELQSQLYMIGAEMSAGTENEPWKIPPPASATDDPVNPAWDEILQHCCGSEKNIITVYKSILKEPLPGELRRVLDYQLDGILSGFLQMKLVRDTLDPSTDIAKE
ncbi:MAG: hypothetical protein M9933_09445 [Chitinophagaceae bacterium]|nr:hypothetical protein [Chitinophagaceae bacterium]